MQTLLKTVAKYKLQKQTTHYQSVFLLRHCQTKGTHCNNSIQRS